MYSICILTEYKNFWEEKMKKEKNCHFAGVLIVCIALGFAGCGNSASQTTGLSANSSGETFNLIVANSVSEASLNHQLCMRVAQLTDEASKGRIKMTIYPNSQLGKTREMVEGNISGNIDILVLAAALYTEFIPALGLFNMPNLFANLGDARRVLDSPEILQEMQKEFEKARLKLFGFTDTGFRQTTTNKPIRQLSDFKGLKLRTMEIPSHIAFWSALGCNPTPVDGSEVFIGLQQKTIDGQENPIQLIIDMKFFEVQKYLILTNHLIFNLITTFNLEKFKTLPAEFQKIVAESIIQANKECREKNDELTVQHIQFLKDKGMEVIELEDSILKEMRAKAVETDKLIRSQVGDALVDKMLQTIKGG
jgi:tripartite ATP-independent transporter DctP family solute receptor